MGFFELLGLIVFLYFIVNIFLWIYLDSDIELFICEKIGKPIDSLRGKVVWITGASSGIGKSLGIVLARHGVKLCLSARREDELDKVKSECLKESSLKPDDIFVLKMDMLQTDKHQDYFDQVIKHFGRVDVLVNNAGRSQRALWQNIDLQVDRELFDLDVFSVVNLSRIYIRHVEKHSLEGHIAVTSSTAGLIGVPNSCSYVGAKHAIHGYFDSLKLEIPDFNVTLFCPGPTTTDFLKTAFTDKTTEVYGGKAEASSKRMSSERCAFLMATSIANKLNTSFVGPFPVPFLAYVSMYCPNLKLLILKLAGKGAMSKIRDPEKKD
ncbi:dehydrogenase/reductase SDR family member 7-like [Bradysia coprophila]|uniref:dehydrogenase/reductase SDR family member 7-like n=1 Tax=Bradysia coprophila TaxID=38358 RepID=UPI00187D9E94|nr:dehydrogenase/reductase SDR family member 7-like [Bradysia coprophila]XP_037040865.1 dehydrogenase/reductase SDR family member 7-like [Bradysia coprophila]